MKKTLIALCVVGLFLVMATLAFLNRGDYFGIQGVAATHKELPDDMRKRLPPAATDIRYWCHSANIYIRFQADKDTFMQWAEAKGYRQKSRPGNWSRSIEVIEHPENGLACGEEADVPEDCFFIYRISNGGGFTTAYLPEKGLVIYRSSTH